MPQRGRMFSSYDVPVCVVIEHDQVGSPPNQDCESGIQTGTDRSAQALRPFGNRAERTGRPVEGAHEGSHLAAPLQTLVPVTEGAKFGMRGHNPLLELWPKALAELIVSNSTPAERALSVGPDTQTRRRRMPALRK